MPDTKVKQEQKSQLMAPEPKPEESGKTEQMCCDGKRTAAEHRKESHDGKCCSDS